MTTRSYTFAGQRVRDRVNLTRFLAAVRDGVGYRELGERFGIHHTTAATWRREILDADARAAAAKGPDA